MAERYFDSGAVKVELLYFDDCPNYELLVPELRQLLAREGIDGALELRRIESSEEAERERFLGSPTVRVEGVDVEPGAAERTDFGLKCRLYASEHGTSGVLPLDWVAARIRDRTADG